MFSCTVTQRSRHLLKSLHCFLNSKFELNYKVYRPYFSSRLDASQLSAWNYYYHCISLNRWIKPACFISCYLRHNSISVQDSSLNRRGIHICLCDSPKRWLSVSGSRLVDDAKHHESIVKKLQQVENSMRYHGYSTIRIGFFIMCALGLSLYMFRESIRENVADEVSQVASRSLEDQMVVVKAEQFAKGLLDAIMNDEQMTKLAAEFVVGVLQRDETKQATARVLLSVIDDPVTREHLILTTKQVFLAALYDEGTQQALKVVFKHILADNETRQAAKDLLAFVFAEDDIKSLVAEFFKEVIRMEVVVSQATELGKNVTQKVISDPVIQMETGNSMWRAFTYSVTPRWFGGSSSPTKPTPPEKESSSSQRETTSAETGETENQSMPLESGQEHDIEMSEGKKDAIKDKKGAIKDQKDAEKILSQQRREEQEEIADLTLAIEEP